MFAIRQRRKTVTEKDFLDGVAKVIKGYAKFRRAERVLLVFAVECFLSLWRSSAAYTARTHRAPVSGAACGQQPAAPADGVVAHGQRRGGTLTCVSPSAVRPAFV